MNGAMAGVAVLAAVIGALVFMMRNHVNAAAKGNRGSRKAACERVAAVIFALAVWCAMIAFAPQLAVLWQVTGTGAGLVILVAGLAVTGVFAFLAVFRGKGHHHHGTVAVSVTFAAALALTIGGWHQITRSARPAMASAGQAARGFVSGTTLARGGGTRHPAVATAHAAGGGRWAVIVALVILAVLVSVFASGYRKARRGTAPRRNQPGPAGNRAIPASGEGR